MIRDELFKQHEDDCGEPYVVLDVNFEVDNYAPMWANAEGAVRLIMEMVEGAPCVVGYSNLAVGIFNQDGEEMDQVASCDAITKEYAGQIREIEEDPAFDLETLER